MAWLRQRDPVTCGPSVAVMAGALLGTDYGAVLSSGPVDAAQRWFDGEQGRVHRVVNVVWPQALGTTPAGMARALNNQVGAHGIRYRWRSAGGSLADVRAAVGAGRPVAMLIGSVVPRHWVLLTELSGASMRCYEPSSGRLVLVAIEDIRRGRLAELGFPRPFAFVVPTG